MQELIEIQNLLKAPKNQRNNFGNYNYRSCEDILEAVKPLCVERGVVLTLTDEVVNVGQFNYVKATARVSNADGLIVECNGFARESVTRKGMDDSQITGSASSYARKYALNGLFCIDDTRDADGDKPPAPKREAPMAENPNGSACTDAQVKKIQVLIREVYPGIADDDRITKLNSWLAKNGSRRNVSSTKQLTKAEANILIDDLEKMVKG